MQVKDTMKMLQGSRVQGMITIGVLSVLLSGAGGLYGQAGNGAGSSYFDLDKAIATNEELIRKYPDSEFAASVMAQLMELYYRKATEDYQRRMAKYEEDLDAFERGIIKSEPIIPRVSYREAMTIGYKLLEKYPTAPFIDRVLYRLAISHQQENTEDKAALYLDRLVREYPDSPYIEEANFRLGEFYFNKRDYQRAIEAYSKLLRKYDSPYFNMALYKLGWAYYSINDYARSIGTFVYLIDDLDRAEKAGADIEGKSSANLRTEAISYIAECFAELGGAAKAQKFIKDFGEKDYSKEVFLRLAEIYESRNFYDESNETYSAIISIWPLYEKAPEAQAKIIENYIKMDMPEKVEKAREDLVANYGPGSYWLSKFPEGEAREKALELAEKNLYILATEAQARGMENKSPRDLRIAIARYQEYLDKFPDTENTAKLQFYQAESYYELGDYIDASHAYEKVLTGFPDSEFASLAAYNRVLANFKLLESTNGAAGDSVAFYIEDFLGTGEVHAIKAPNEFYEEAFKACNDYARFLPGDKKLPEVMMKFGESLFKLAYYDLARQAYTMVVNRGEQTPLTLLAYSMIAQSAFNANDFITAEKWYSRIKAEFPDSTRYVRKATKMIASAKYKLAEGLDQQGNKELSARAFVKIAADTEDPEIAERALWKAAAQYEEIGDKTQAIIILENLRFRFPKSAKIDQALFKAAVLSEQLPDYKRAAENYLELTRLRPNSVHAEKALYNAAVCYESLQDKDRAAQIYAQYAAKYSVDPDKTLDALIKVGEAAFARKEYKKASSVFRDVLRRYANWLGKGKMVDHYLAANAQFMLGEILFQDYKKIKLVKPQKRNLQRKEAAFKRVIEAYTKAAKYAVADWRTAALYRIGETFEEFGRFYWDSPRPKQLDENSLSLYESKLKEQVVPLQKKALTYYRANLKTAEENNIQNDWISKSRSRAEELTIELGLAQAPAPAAGETTGGGYVNKSEYNEK